MVWFCIFELFTLENAWPWRVPKLGLIMAFAERIDDHPLASPPCIQSGVLSVKEFAWAFLRASVGPFDTRSRCCAFPHNVHIPTYTHHMLLYQTSLSSLITCHIYYHNIESCYTLPCLLLLFDIEFAFWHTIYLVIKH
jgi:hypothetical protein